MEISKKNARRFLLTHHYLYPPRIFHGDEGVLDYIRHVGCIQFDPINIVGRNPDLVLQSRIKDYKASNLDKLLYITRELIDGWDKMASIYATEEWPFFTRYRDSVQKRTLERRPTQSVINSVLNELRNHGPHSSLHYKDNEKVDWFWGPTKIARAALEYLYSIGRIGIENRINNRRNFDLLENLLPKDIQIQPDPFETMDDYHDWHFYRRVGSMGIIDSRSENWYGILDVNRTSRDKTLARLTANDKLTKFTIEGLPVRHYYIRTEDFPTLNKVKSRDASSFQAAIIAPLDNLIWNRKMIKEVFEFEYVWEVYKPKKDRKFGYYVLPILYHDQFVARFEPSFDKKTRTFTIKNWWWEKYVTPNPQLNESLENCFNDFVQYLEAESLRLGDDIKDSHILSWANNVNCN